MMRNEMWAGLENASLQAIGRRVPMITGLGMTESSPSAMFANWPGSTAGLVGCPVPGLTAKLVPAGDKTELRYHGPNVTPGYWRQPDTTAAAFDTEGFLRTGDAVKFADPANPNAGLVFDGRITEDFKLNTGTWVSVGALRVCLVQTGAPLLQDVVIAGHDRQFLAAVLFLNVEACRGCAGGQASTTADDLASHPAVRAAIQEFLDDARKPDLGAMFSASSTNSHPP